MNWIKIEDKLPELNQRVLAYRIVHIGGYVPGVYKVIYAFPHDHDKYFFIIDDAETNRNNYRPIKEFSHWMPLPLPPV